MTGIFWPVFTFSAVVIFLCLVVYRVLAIRRLPVHLRWELAPIPHETGQKRQYGGSYLEEYEWWQKPRRKSRIAPIIYMLMEIFLLKGVWKNNRSLWPFSFSLHAGIYLFILSLIFHLINALLITTEAPLSVLNVFQGIAAVVAAAAYILGSLGAIGLIFKRAFDAGLRSFGSFSTYFRLVFLAVVFISGAIARFFMADFSLEMGSFVRGIITLDAGVALTISPAVHVIFALLFIIYLPLTDMVHFITKYFTYHAVRWNDAPQDRKMAESLRGLAAQPLDWSAGHVGADGRRDWADIAAGKAIEKEKP